MAKIVKLTINNETTYPVSITEAIADIERNDKLSNILTSVIKQASGWKIVKDNDNSAIYYLKNADDDITGTINIAEGSLVGTVVSDIEYDDITSIFN